MHSRSELFRNSLIDDSENVVSFNEAVERRYNPQAAYYALPKAFINRLLIRLSGSTLKVFLALVSHTDCWNIIKFPDKITHSALMKTTGIRKKDTITKAYKELCSLNIIGGYIAGHGKANTEFYFTFDVNHYKTEEYCLDPEEISSYYEMLLSGKYPGSLPEEYRDHPEAGQGSLPKKQGSLPKMQGSAEKRDTSDKIKMLITNAHKDLKFKHEFNKFCIEVTSKKYLKNTLFLIAKKSVEFDLSLGEVIDSLAAANDKGKHGSLGYLTGIMRNKSRNKSGGIGVITRPVFVQVKDYFRERFSHCLEFLEWHEFDIESNQLQYKLKNPQVDSDSMDEFFRFVVDDIKKAVGVSLSHIEVS